MLLLCYCVSLYRQSLGHQRPLEASQLLAIIATNILSLFYHVTQMKVQLIPLDVAGEEVMLIYPTVKAFISAKSHITLLKGFS